MRIYFALAALTLLLSTLSIRPAHAGPYGTAGCGLGSMLFSDTPGIVQIFSSTTNGTLSNQWFAISSGTSNCGKGNKAEAMAFLDVNKSALAKDVARGEGEVIDSFARLLGCPVDPLANELKRNYGEIFNRSDIRPAVFDVIQKNTDLRQCSALALQG